VAQSRLGLPQAVVRRCVAPFVLPRRFRLFVGDRRGLRTYSHSGRLLREHSLSLREFEASHDGRKVALYDGGELSVYEEDELLFTKKSAAGNNVLLRFAPDDRTLAASTPFALELLAIGTGEVLWRLEREEEPPEHIGGGEFFPTTSTTSAVVEFSPDGAFLFASFGETGALRRVDTGDVVWDLFGADDDEDDDEGTVEAVRFVGENELAVIFSRDSHGRGYFFAYGHRRFDLRDGAGLRHTSYYCKPAHFGGNFLILYEPRDTDSHLYSLDDPDDAFHVTDCHSNLVFPPTCGGVGPTTKVKSSSSSSSENSSVALKWHETSEKEHVVTFLDLSGPRVKDPNLSDRFLSGSAVLGSYTVPPQEGTPLSTTFAPDGSLLCVETEVALTLVEVPGGRVRATIPKDDDDPFPKKPRLKCVFV